MLNSPRAFHLACCALYSLLCVAWSARVGPQFLWDYQHYHVYVAHAWAESRLPAELFAADAQGYLNPIAHLPFYAVWRATENSLLGTLWIALLHGINLWCLHFITCQLIDPTTRLNRLLVVSAVMLGALSPGFLFELGSSYTDVIVSIPTLIALWGVLVWRNKEGGKLGGWLYLAGFFAGISVGLKPSSLIFCGALGLALLVSVRPGEVWSVVGRLLVSGGLGIGVAGGSHAWMLWEAFGSPVFPLFNGFFLSPWFQPVSFTSDRFLVTSFADMLLFPFHMADSARRTSFESMTVDIRPGWMIALAVVAAGGRLVAWVRGRRLMPVGGAGTERLFWGFLLVFIPVWIYVSGNIRYAIPALMLLGPAIALLALKLGRNRELVAMLAVLLPVVAQSAPAMGLNTPNILGYHSQAWGRPWFDMKIPAPLDVQPAYYLSLQAQSYASLAPLFPAQSRFFNLIGITAVGPDGLVFKRVEANQESLGLPFRTLYDATAHFAKIASIESTFESQDLLLSEFGYQIDRYDCHAFQNQEPDIHLVSCGVRKAPPLSLAERERRRTVDERFSRWEQKCPRVFAASGIASVQGLESRRRFYPATDFQLLALRDGRLFALDLFNKCRSSILLEEKDGAVVAADCPRREPFLSKSEHESVAGCSG